MTVHKSRSHEWSCFVQSILCLFEIGFHVIKCMEVMFCVYNSRHGFKS